MTSLKYPGDIKARQASLFPLDFVHLSQMIVEWNLDNLYFNPTLLTCKKAQFNLPTQSLYLSDGIRKDIGDSEYGRHRRAPSQFSFRNFQQIFNKS